MCDPITMMTAGTALLSTALGVSQQMQRAAEQRNDLNYLAAQQRNAAATEEQQAQLALQEGEAEEERLRSRTAQRLGTAQARMASLPQSRLHELLPWEWKTPRLQTATDIIRVYAVRLAANPRLSGRAAVRTRQSLRT